MSLEGRLRDLGLPEVCQLLGASRKSGTLRVRARLRGCAGEIRLVQGFVADAAHWPEDRESPADEPPRAIPTAADVRLVQAHALELLTWRDGEFSFLAERASARSASPLRLAVEPLLVEAAHSAAVWELVRERVSGPSVIPAFVDIDPQQLPRLRLKPQEWEVLTRVDANRDLSMLAHALSRSVLEIAQMVHALIGAGVLTLRESVLPRRHPTPPSQLILSTVLVSDHAPEPDSTGAVDSEIGDAIDRVAEPGDQVDDDSIFDPVAAGMLDAEGLPQFETARAGHDTAPPGGSMGPGSSVPCGAASVVASSPEEQSHRQMSVGIGDGGDCAEELCRRGDALARHGDLAGALHHWTAALRSDASLIDADRVREAIALAARMHALLHPVSGV